MNFKFVFENILAIASSAALILVPYYSWKSFYSNYKYLNYKYQDEVLFLKRHNCVVIYTSNKGMSGWPPYNERIVPDISNEKWCDMLYEPIIYFINTAKNTLDVAVMMISVKSIYQALISAQKRGVKVRLLLNFEHCDSMLEEIRRSIKEGLEVQLYISQKPNQSSIMHYKYMVKDYSTSSGYVWVGSMNLTGSAFLNNYEDIVFSTNHDVTKSFHGNFVKCFNFVKEDNENLINKTMLLDMNLVG